jgi:hypothetical protein
MKRGKEAFVGIDAAEARNAVTVAEGDRQGEMRYVGEFDASLMLSPSWYESWLTATKRYTSVMKRVPPGMACTGPN